MTDWASLSYAVVSVQGNGQLPPDLVEVAVVPVARGVVGEPACWLVRPPHPIKHLATRLHGLATGDVVNCPPLADVNADVIRALGADALVGHNVHVDVDVLRRELAGWEAPEAFDTLGLARRLAPGLPGYGLGALAGALGLAQGLPGGLVPHRAGYDALVTARLFVALAARAGTLEGLRDGRPCCDAAPPGGRPAACPGSDRDAAATPAEAR